MTDAPSMNVVAGIDVGGDKKGCNLVVLQGTSILCSLKSKAPEDLVATCAEYAVTAVGVDAPCRWRTGSGAREAEKELARSRISSFSTPTRELALSNTANFYGWMFNGERVYQALSTTYPLLAGKTYSGGRISFETFPYAITCAMLGRDVASAKKKRTQRRQLLDGMGIDISMLRSIDAVDAALCALTAQYLLAGKAMPYGDIAGGYIWVPSAMALASRRD
jgi:predicted nuclease with RNAse H fold